MGHLINFSSKAVDHFLAHCRGAVFSLRKLKTSMAVVAMLSMLVCALFVPYAQSLVCYDNVAAGEPVFIDCSFSGGACAVTNMTATKTLYGIPYVENKLLYHCAHEKRSCLTGPMNYCNKAKLTTVEKVDCNTWCCTKDKCNVPEKANINVTAVSRRKALPCYQIVGSKQERVKCMFADSYCLYAEYGSLFATVTGEEISASQMCSTKSHCDKIETACELLKTPSRHSYGYFNSLSKTCSVKCCKTSYCNSLPYRYRYEGGKSGPKKNTKTKPDWFNSGTYGTPTEAAVNGQNYPADDWLHPDTNDETNDYDSGTYTGYGVGDYGAPVKGIISVVLIVALALGIAAVRRGCKRQRSIRGYRGVVITSREEAHAVDHPEGRRV